MSDNLDIEAQGNLAAALRQVFNQLIRLLETSNPDQLLGDKGAVGLALEGWRRSVAAQTAGLKVQQARELKAAKLDLMARVGQLEKANQDLRERNAHVRDEIVRLSKNEVALKQKLTDVQLTSNSFRDEARALDLEVRDLRRKVRELEGGPPLTAEEAAPRSKAKKEVAPLPEEKKVSLADAVAAHMDTKKEGASDAMAAAQAAFANLAKKEAVDNEAAPAPAVAVGKPVVDKEPAAEKKPVAGVKPALETAPVAAKKGGPKRQRTHRKIQIAVTTDSPAAGEPSKSSSSRRRSRRRRGGKGRTPQTQPPQQVTPVIDQKPAVDTRPVAADEKKTVDTKPVAPKKVAPALKAAPEEAAAKKAAPKKAAAKKAAPKKAAAKKAAPKKAAAKKKAVAKKATPRK